MAIRETDLEEEFVDDHRVMTQTISALLEALRAGRDAEAREIAEDLDRRAGPHIAFEEAVMYPQVARVSGESVAQQLYDEHRTVLAGLEQLLNHRGSTPLGEEQRAQVIAKMQTGLDHAISCGSLLSHLTALDPQIQQQMLDRLHEYRREGTRWTTLHR